MTMNDARRPLDLEKLHLSVGSHMPPADEEESGPGDMCLMEAAAYMAGEPWSDHPICVSAILGMYGRELNDILSGVDRQRLRPLIPAMLGTSGDGHHVARWEMCLSWIEDTYLAILGDALPRMWLRNAPSRSWHSNRYGLQSYRRTYLSPARQVALYVPLEQFSGKFRRKPGDVRRFQSASRSASSAIVRRADDWTLVAAQVLSIEEQIALEKRLADEAIELFRKMIFIGKTEES